MKSLYFLSLSTLAVSALLLMTPVQAHDPSLHKHEEEAKPKPSTCAQLADTKNYSADLKDPEVKALKARCDTSKKADTSSGN